MRGQNKTQSQAKMKIIGDWRDYQLNTVNQLEQRQGLTNRWKSMSSGNFYLEAVSCWRHGKHIGCDPCAMSLMFHV